MTVWHLVQFNIALAKHDVDDPRMAEFVANLEPINRLGDEWPGAVWRHQSEDGDSTSTLVFDNPRLLVNYTIWESVEALHEYTYKSGHVEFLRRRREWFDPFPELPGIALWWERAGVIPTIEECEAKILHLRDHGPTEAAFTFRTTFPKPS